MEGRRFSCYLKTIVMILLNAYLMMIFVFFARNNKVIHYYINIDDSNNNWYNKKSIMLYACYTNLAIVKLFILELLVLQSVRVGQVSFSIRIPYQDVGQTSR